MRKILVAVFTAVLFLGAAPNAQAQGFEKGKIYLDLGVGAPRYSYGAAVWGYYGANYHRTPSFRFSARYGFNEFISGGLYVGYAHYGWKSTNNVGFESHDLTRRIPVGVGASFHVWSFLNNTLDLGLGVEKLDLFVTLMTGADIRTYSEKRPSYHDTYTRVGPYFGSMVGARYFFLDWMGAYVQFGYGMNSYVEGGLTFKF